MSNFSRVRVGVMRGGPSSEYEVSLKTGSAVLKNLPEEYTGVDVFIDRDGIWHIDGIPVSYDTAFRRADVFVNAMHGEYGEDGTVQHILDKHNVPYTGAKQFASSLAMNKILTKQMAMREGIRTPMYMVLDREDATYEKLLDIFRRMPHPVIVKPASLGSSVGVSIARSFDELKTALENVFGFADRALLEEFISGKEATCGVIDDFRGEKIYSLLPVEILPLEKKNFFDYEAKYSGGSKEICPGNFSEKEKEEIQKLAKKIHEIIGLKHYSRSDFIVHPKRGIYFLEVNSLPGMTEQSLFPLSLNAVGSNLTEFLRHIITLAIEKK